jgi:hypothetical protein
LELDYSENYSALFDSTNPNPSNMLNAVAAILVRDHRVVAAVVPDSVPGDSDLCVYGVIQDDEPQFPDVNFEDHGVVVTNTDTKYLTNAVITKGTTMT